MPANTNGQFQAFGLPHLAAIALVFLVAVALPLWARRDRSTKVAQYIRWAIVAALLASELTYYAVGLATASATELAQSFLPLHICGLAVYLLIWTLIRPTQILFEIVYFWVLAGTTQAMLTPNLSAGWPSFWFVIFFATHGLAVIGVLFATLGMRMQPRRGAVLRVVLITNAWMGIVAVCNWLLDANYMFLCEPPIGTTPFYFLPWPWYILFLELLGVALLWGLYLPFWLGNRKRDKPGGHSAC